MSMKSLGLTGFASTYVLIVSPGDTFFVHLLNGYTYINVERVGGKLGAIDIGIHLNNQFMKLVFVNKPMDI